MAEAHQAVAFSFQITHEGLEVDFNREVLSSIWISGIRSFYKHAQRHWHDLRAGLYPLEPHTLALAIGIVFTLRFGVGIDPSFGYIDAFEHHIPWEYLAPTFALYLSTLTFGILAWFGLILFIRYALKLLFMYQGWMNEPRGKMSLKTKIWAMLVKLLKGRNPHLYSYQGSLPKLPLPKLNDTLQRFLLTVRPLLSDAEYEDMEHLAEEFKNNLGKRLQRYLWLKSWWATNYVSDWWEEMVYLKGRAPVVVNSNYYGLDAILIKPTHIQAARAANCINAMLRFRSRLNRQLIPPIVVQNLIPLCSAQNERIFNTTRIPGIDTDHLMHLHDSTHVAVYHRGRFFKLPCYRKGRLLNPAELEVLVNRIIADESEPAPGEKYLAALTAGERATWAQARMTHFRKGMNKTSLDVIEKAAFFMALDDDEFYYDPDDRSKMDGWAASMLHGNCYNRWFDKSFTFIVLKNGHLGLNIEHSWADAPTFNTVAEYYTLHDDGSPVRGDGPIIAFTEEYFIGADRFEIRADAPIMGYLWEEMMFCDHDILRYKEDGHCLGEVNPDLPPIQRLKWDLNDEVVKVIHKQLAIGQSLAADVDMRLSVFREYGKGFIKTCKVSPDAYLQMSLQLAYYRDAGRFDLTYEASMTRLFREGRTETVRPVSFESCAFVRAMEDPNSNDEERIRLLRIACDSHVNRYKDAMLGKGVDRHLFCLYVVSRYLEEDSPFLEKVLSEPWKLSTSQTPHSQTNRWDIKKHPEYICAGGGFGPVADDGYGVSYIIAGEETIFFHVSAKKSSSVTDATRFRAGIEKAMRDMRTLHESAKI